MGLDHGGRAADRLRFDSIRVDRPLRQELDSAESRGLVLEDLDEDLADDLPLGLRIDDPLQPLQEQLSVAQHADVEMELLAEPPIDLLDLPLAEEAVVDEEAGEPLADGARHEDGHDR